MHRDDMKCHTMMLVHSQKNRYAGAINNAIPVYHQFSTQLTIPLDTEHCNVEVTHCFYTK